MDSRNSYINDCRMLRILTNEQKRFLENKMSQKTPEKSFDDVRMAT